MRKTNLKKQTKLFLILILVATVLFVACSSDEEKPAVPPQLSTSPDRTIVFPPQDEEYDEDLIVVLPVVHFTATATQNDVSAVPLSYFILNYDSENYARMHTYQITAHDGITSRREGSSDLVWNTFRNGHFLIDTIRTYFHTQSLSANYNYNIQLAKDIRLYRSIIVVKPDGEEVLFQVNILKHENRNNPQNNNTTERAFKMSDLISTYITKSPQNYEYFLTAADFTGGNTGSATLQWSDMQSAWYSRNIDRVFFPTMPADMPGVMRLRDVIRVELFLRQ